MKLGLKSDLYESLTCNILPYVWAADGDVLDEYGEIVFDNKEGVKAFEFLDRMWRDGPINENSIVEEAMLTNPIFMALDWPCVMGMLQNACRSDRKSLLSPLVRKPEPRP